MTISEFCKIHAEILWQRANNIITKEEKEELLRECREEFQKEAT